VHLQADLGIRPTTKEGVVEKARRREAILQAARSVFAEKGYHQSSVADILAAADIARGTFYLYFDSKRAIFDELVEIFLVALRSGIRDLDPNPPRGHPSAFEQLRGNVRRTLALLQEEREMAVILLSHAVGLDREFDARLDAFYDRTVELIASAVRRGIDMGLVRSCDPHLVAGFLVGGLKETAYRLVVRELDRPGPDELVDELLKTSLVGLLARPPAEEGA
jgi:AcrR family transcriptional regulator